MDGQRLHEMRCTTSPRRSRGTTCSPRTGRSSRRSAARAAAGPRSGPRRSARSPAARRSSGAGSRTSTRRFCARTTGSGRRLDEVEFHPAWHRLMELGVESGLHALPWREPVARRARRARGDVRHPLPGRGGRALPAGDDLRRPAGAPRDRRTVAAEWEPRLTSLAYEPGLRPAGSKARSAVRDGADREAGRLRRRGERDGGAAARRRRGDAARSQVVLFGADVRCLPRPRTVAGRTLLLPAPARAPGRRAEPPAPAAAEGQARQPLERLGRDRARRRLGAARRRGGARRANDRGDDQPHAASTARSARSRSSGGRSRRRRTTPRTDRRSASCSPSSR